MYIFFLWLIARHSTHPHNMPVFDEVVTNKIVSKDQIDLFTGGLTVSGGPLSAGAEIVTATGAISVNTLVTILKPGAGSVAYRLGDGVDGQVKIIAHHGTATPHNGVVTLDTASSLAGTSTNNNTITFEGAANKVFILAYVTNKWELVLEIGSATLSTV